jgi:single-strand DNA-binding protein
MNKVILCGRFTRDPEIRYTESVNPLVIAKFSMAVDRRFKREGEQSADFINCIAFGKTAEFIEKYCHKGIKMIAEGRWQTGSYTNKDGNKVYTNDCVVENIEFAESKNSDAGQTAPAGEQKKEKDSFMEIPDGIEEQLPFA